MKLLIQKQKKKKRTNNRDRTITSINAGSLTLADLFLSQIRSRERYNQSYHPKGANLRIIAGQKIQNILAKDRCSMVGLGLVVR